MVTTTSQDLDWQPVADLRPGTYFKDHHGEWRLALAMAQYTNDQQLYPWTIRVARPNGDTGLQALYANRVKVAAPGTRPATFDPASMRRRAQQDEAKAQDLLMQAGARRQLARKIESGAEIR